MNGDNSLFDLIFPQMNPAVTESTGVAHDKINSLLSQQGETTQPSLFPTGSIYQTPEDKRNIIQKLADEFYESGPIGSVAAAAADILPGIPFVDIIDPPPQLSDPQMQTSRNLLSALGIPLSMSQAPKAVGRVATNIKAPFNYSISDVKPNIMYGGGKGQESYWSEPSMIKRIAGAIGRTTKSIIQDKPLYGKMKKQRPGALFGEASFHDTAVNDAREYLYRKAFGLKPRKGTKIFKENKDGTLSFNPKSKRGKELVNQIKDAARTKQFEEDRILPNLFTPRHDVMGGYSLKLGKHTGFPMRNPTLHTADFAQKGRTTERVIMPTYNPPRPPSSRYSNIKIEPTTSYTKIADYEDIWDFKMNPGEWAKALNPNIHLPGLAKYYPYKAKRQGIGAAGLRTLVNMMIKPPVIKGTVRY